MKIVHEQNRHALIRNVSSDHHDLSDGFGTIHTCYLSEILSLTRYRYQYTIISYITRYPQIATIIIRQEDVPKNLIYKVIANVASMPRLLIILQKVGQYNFKPPTLESRRSKLNQLWDHFQVLNSRIHKAATAEQCSTLPYYKKEDFCKHISCRRCHPPWRTTCSSITSHPNANVL